MDAGTRTSSPSSAADSDCHPTLTDDDDDDDELAAHALELAEACVVNVGCLPSSGVRMSVSDEKPTVATAEASTAMAPKPPVHSPASAPSTLARWRRRAVLAGIVLAIVCKFLPVDYRGPCQAVASLCTGGF